jgi:hypothetical protein
VTAPDGHRLDGEWPIGLRSASVGAFVSGDGAAGGDFQFPISFLGGDTTRDGTVNALDLANVRRRLNSTIKNEVGAGYSIFADFNGDGRINALDLACPAT